MPPLVITNVSPTAITSSTAALVAIALMLNSVGKLSGFITLKKATTSSSTKKIPAVFVPRIRRHRGATPEESAGVIPG